MFWYKFSKKIESIHKAAERISKIVRGLKKFSRSSLEESEFKNHKLIEIVNEARALTEILTRRHDIMTNFELSSDAIIFCDELEIEQVLINLISNSVDAIKNNSEKWIKISISEDSEMILLRIIDSGTGIPNEIQSKLFDPFFTTKNVGEGTGLGLSITKGILDKHHAKILVTTEGKNTCFEVQFRKVQPATT